MLPGARLFHCAALEWTGVRCGADAVGKSVTQALSAVTAANLLGVRSCVAHMLALRTA